MVETKTIERKLEAIGLEPKEAVVYVALVALGSATAYQIAQRCSVKKPTVYVILEDLRKKGLVLKVPHAKKALFSARNLEEYLEAQREHIRTVESALPQLRLLRAQQTSNTYFYTGLSGVKEALLYREHDMRDKTYLSFYGNLEGCAPELMSLYASWERTSIARGVSARILAQKKDFALYYTETLQLSKKYPVEWQIKLLEKSIFPGHVSFEAGNGFVRIIDAKNLNATILDDAAIADAFHQILEIVWEKGE